MKRASIVAIIALVFPGAAGFASPATPRAEDDLQVVTAAECV